MNFLSMEDAEKSCLDMKKDSKKKIILFDIDHTLYYSPELAEFEKELKRSEFIRIYNEENGSSEQNTSKANSMFTHHLKKGRPICDLFVSHLAMGVDEYFYRYDDLEYDKYIKKDSELVEIFELLSQKFRIYAITNSSSLRCKKILELLEISKFFDYVFCAKVLKFDNVDQYLKFKKESKGEASNSASLDEKKRLLKPEKGAFLAVLRFICNNDHKLIHFYDDINKNIIVANEIGLIGTLVVNEDPTGEKCIKPLLNKLLA